MGVNALVFPSVHLRDAREAIDGMAEDGMPDPDPRFVAFYADMLEHSASAVHAYRVCHFSEETSDLSEAYDAARERDREMHRRVREDEFHADGWLIHGPLLIEVDRLLDGLGGHEQDEESDHHA